MMAGRRRAGGGCIEGGARPAVLECGVLRVAECDVLRVAECGGARAANTESLIRSSNAVEGRRGGR